MTNYRVNVSTLSGDIIAPPSKSHTLRAILFASMAEGKSSIYRYLKSPDTLAMLDACRQLGAKIQLTDDVIIIQGVAGKPQLPDDVINAGNSGQVLRFIAAIAALTEGYVVITGDHSVRFNRPVKPLMKGLSDLGAICLSTRGDDHAPIIIKGPISPGSAVLEGADSQPVSGLLIACAFLKGKTKIQVNNPGEKPWVHLTLAWFDQLGIAYTNDNFEHYTLEGSANIKGFEYTVPGDFSAIAYPLVAALVTQSTLAIHHIDINDVQGDKKIIEVLCAMGANITINKNHLVVKPSGKLVGCDIDVNDFIDALPILAVMGCYASGCTRLLNAKIARAKESDRLHAITMELRKMGANILETKDSLTIYGATLQGETLYSHQDHRIAMSLTVAALAAKSTSMINEVACIAKSYPDFFTEMKSIGCAIEAVHKGHCSTR